MPVTGTDSIGNLAGPEQSPKAIGLCFKEAFNFISDAEGDFMLVHGHLDVINDAGINHAWVEKDDIVFDMRNGRCAKKDYYEWFGAKETRRYTVLEALAADISTGHFGPWDELPNVGKWIA